MKAAVTLRLFPAVLIAARFVGNQVESDSSKDKDKYILSQKSIEAQNEFRTFLKPQQIVTSEEARRARSKAWNSYHKSETYPSMIVFPER